ncbi:MAG TPA: DUF5330 domain-containing protein [Xanthobacteraceae bacterium]|jgi:hypothetical protein|nr:DUF5330 domain-containing protein [Xanthobacteraceae bacterium]
MMFLLRVAFWLSVVLVLLPSGESKDRSQDSGPQISAGEAVSAAGATVSDMRQFCVRQPEACAVGTQAAIAFGQRVQAGAKTLLEFFNEKIAPQVTGSVGGDSGKFGRGATGKASQDTLTPADITPSWRGPHPRNEAQGKNSV